MKTKNIEFNTSGDKYIVNEQKLINLMLKNKKTVSQVIESEITRDILSERHQDIIDCIFREHKANCLLTRNTYHAFLLEKYGKDGIVLTGLKTFDACDLKVTGNINDYSLYIKEIFNGYAARHTAGALDQFSDNRKELGVLEAGKILADDLAKLKKVGDSGLNYAFANNIQEKEMTWLWKEWLVRGMINLLSGECGVGKGAFTIDICSRISNGTPFPVTGDITKGKVLILSGEDDPNKTIVPRLNAAKANLNNIIILHGKKDGTTLRLDYDLERVSELLKAYPDIKLVIIDPIDSYCGDTKDTTLEVRNFLYPIEMMAHDTDCCILIIKHYKKGAGKSKERTSGNQAWVNAPRSVIGISEDFQDDTLKHLYPIKTNNGIKPKAITFRTISSPYESPVVKKGSMVCIEFGEESQYTASDFACQTYDTTSGNKLQQVTTMLKHELSTGPKEFNYLVELAKDEGISVDTLRRAKTKMGIVSVRQGFGAGSTVAWSLPNLIAEINKDSLNEDY